MTPPAKQPSQNFDDSPVLISCSPKPSFVEIISSKSLNKKTLLHLQTSSIGFATSKLLKISRTQCSSVLIKTWFTCLSTEISDHSIWHVYIGTAENCSQCWLSQSTPEWFITPKRRLTKYWWPIALFWSLRLWLSCLGRPQRRLLTRCSPTSHSYAAIGMRVKVLAFIIARWSIVFKV